MKLEKNGMRHLMMLLVLMFVSITAQGQRQIEISYTDGTATERFAMSDIGRMWLAGYERRFTGHKTCTAFEGNRENPVCHLHFGESRGDR